MQQPKLKLTDEQKIMDWIHGYKESEPQVSAPRPRHPRKIPSQRYHDGIFEGTFQGPRMFGQSIISQTIRKPDGVSSLFISWCFIYLVIKNNSRQNFKRLLAVLC